MPGGIAHSEMKTGVTEITITTLFMGVAFILFLVTLVNLGIAAGFWGAGGDVAAGNAGSVRHAHDVEFGGGDWESGIFHAVSGCAVEVRCAVKPNPPAWLNLLPAWIAPRDPEIIKGFFEGNSSFFRAEVMRAWAFPAGVVGRFLRVAACGRYFV